jgi:hypothetical protein
MVSSKKEPHKGDTGRLPKRSQKGLLKGRLLFITLLLGDSRLAAACDTAQSPANASLQPLCKCRGPVGTARVRLSADSAVAAAASSFSGKTGLYSIAPTGRTLRIASRVECGGIDSALADIARRTSESGVAAALCHRTPQSAPHVLPQTASLSRITATTGLGTRKCATPGSDGIRKS